MDGHKYNIQSNYFQFYFIQFNLIMSHVSMIMYPQVL